MQVRFTAKTYTAHSTGFELDGQALTLQQPLPEGVLLKGERQDGNLIRFKNAQNWVYMKALISRLYRAKAFQFSHAAPVAAPVVEADPVAHVAAVPVPVTEVAPVASVVEVACEEVAAARAEVAAARAEASVAEVACEEEAV